jgi:hypothetical protein
MNGGLSGYPPFLALALCASSAPRDGVFSSGSSTNRLCDRLECLASWGTLQRDAFGITQA